MLLGNIVFFKDILCTSFLSHAHRDVHSHGFGKESLKKVSTSFLVFCVYIHSTQTPMPSLKLVFQPTNKISKNPYHPQNGGAKEGDTINPNNPITDAKISTIKTITNKVGSAPSARA